MKNERLFPFERNKYFYGKLLTVRDLQLEQKYVNDKRRLINRLLHGAGIVCGLNVVYVDDQTISVENGMALDYGGREIVVDKPIIKKLPMIEGFDKITDQTSAYLCIAYDEEEKEPVHSIANSSMNYEEVGEFNRYKEGYSLYLNPKEPNIEDLSLKRIVEEEVIIYKDRNVTIKHLTPRFANPLEEMQMLVCVEKHGEVKNIEFRYDVELEHFTTKNGEKFLRIEFNEKNLGDKEYYEIPYILKANNVKQVKGTIKFNPDTFRMTLGDTNYYTEFSKINTVEIITEDIKDKVIERYYQLNMDELVECTDKQEIILAKIDFIKEGSHYIIQRVVNNPLNQYILNTELKHILEDLKDKELVTHAIKDSGKKAASDHIHSSETNPLQTGLNMASGTAKIDFGIEPKYKKIYYSDEIVHGLGIGDANIQTAIEVVGEDTASIENEKLIFGDKELFKELDTLPVIPKVNIGVIAYPKKGTFRIGVQLQETTDVTEINIKWWAYKKVLSTEDIEKKEIEVIINPDVANVTCRSKVNFTATVKGTDNQECIWKLNEEKAGSIDQNGVFIAGNVPGVYEIIAESKEDSTKQASAFVVIEED
ncbi:hypothetical protein [Defluviitalea saccharophila]|uniref:BIG2 domain-containing protein n=1 Tax=Defluviitalea saccharophila TaxID=879970 RepID=A0ABZ2Y730_9FIRM